MCNCCYPCNCRRPYGFFNFLFDCTMVVLTYGFWLIWIFVRQTNKR